MVLTGVASQRDPFGVTSDPIHRFLQWCLASQRVTLGVTSYPQNRFLQCCLTSIPDPFDAFPVSFPAPAQDTIYPTTSPRTAERERGGQGLSRKSSFSSPEIPDPKGKPRKPRVGLGQKKVKRVVKL